jgi:putative transposase
MAWKERSVVDARIEFIEEFRGEVEPSLASVCRRYGISRRTGYKWLRRYQEGGEDKLVNGSRRAAQPQRSPLELEDLIVELRGAHPDWGPKKLITLLSSRWSGMLPVVSTVGAVLKRRGLIHPRRRRVGVRRGDGGPLICTLPNDLWCTDFKGHFRLGNGYVCHPFTLTDACSRYLLRCQGLPDEKGDGVRRELELAFQAFGMPWRLRSDNGPPFGASAPGGLSRNAIWLIQLGITPEFITPGHPEENGRHERFHRTLKDATASPPKEDMPRQQQAFDHFGREYNDERPHEALGQVPPRARYEPSTRTYSGKLNAPEYEGAEVRLVSSSGSVSFQGKFFYVGSLLSGQPVALYDVGHGVHDVRYGAHCLGFLVARDKKPRLRPERPQSVPAVVDPDLRGSVCATEPPTAVLASSDSREEVLGL